MANQALSERLQPSLLDRLTDLRPEAKTDNRDEAFLSVNKLRDIVKRDLASLLNTNNNESFIDEERFPNISKSVLNYGLSNVSGNFSTANRAAEMQEAIEKAIVLFEPRIIKDTIYVEVMSDNLANGTIATFDIQADMWADGSIVELYFRSKVDFKTGQLILDRKG